MGKRSVYFDAEMEEEMSKYPDLPLSLICQNAVREAMRSGNTSSSKVYAVGSRRRKRADDPVDEAHRLIRQADRLLASRSKKVSAKKP